MYTLISATGHDVVRYRAQAPDRGTEAELAPHLIAVMPPSAYRPRLHMTALGVVELLDVDGEPAEVYGMRCGEVYGLPAPTPGVRFVVSLATALGAGRDDLVVPHDVVRNARGTVIGCRAFGRVLT